MLLLLLLLMLMMMLVVLHRVLFVLSVRKEKRETDMKQD
jgi:hypothetical protein